MKTVPDRRPFSELGDQQLLDQAKCLVATQRGLEVRILDHLDEIDRRGLALRRGYSSLFDYAVRELRFTDAAAQRRIQTMRLCRRHGWVRAKLPGVPSPCDDRDHAPGLAPQAGKCSGDAAANAPVEPMASDTVATGRGIGHAGTLLPQPELNGDAAPEVSPQPLSAAPLLHPQRQRELIEQAAGMSTRQVAGLLAAAAPEVARPRDTLRAVAPDRYTLKVSIDQECEQGLRLLKDLRSHLDPHMSWGDLVARLVREAVARHDPRGEGRGQRRRRREGNADAALERAPARTRPAGASAAVTQCDGSDTAATQDKTRAASGQTPALRAPATAPLRPPAPAAPARGARQDAVPSVAPETTAAPKFTGATSPDGADAAPVALGASPAADPAVGVADGDEAAGVPAGLAYPLARDAAHGPHRAPPRRPIPAAVRRHVWQRDGGRYGYRDPLTGRCCGSSHLLQIDHLLQVAQGGGPEPENLQLACFAHHRMRHGHGPAPPPEPPR